MSKASWNANRKFSGVDYSDVPTRRRNAYGRRELDSPSSRSSANARRRSINTQQKERSSQNLNLSNSPSHGIGSSDMYSKRSKSSTRRKEYANKESDAESKNFGSKIAMPLTPSSTRSRRLANSALQELYGATQGDSWRCSEWWMAPGSEVRLWHGVTVEKGALSGLRLPRNNMNGILPQSLGHLETLKLFDLSFNQELGGILPKSLGLLLELRILNLSGCSFEGPLPESFGDLIQLRELRLTGNRITGKLPKSLGKLVQLEELHLNSNDFEGPIPSTFGRLASLKVMDLSYNRLEGEVPDHLGSLITLVLLRLEGNPHLNGLPDADSGMPLQTWLNRKLYTHATRLHQRAKLAEQEKEEEVVRLSVALERSRRRVRTLEQHNSQAQAHISNLKRQIQNLKQEFGDSPGSSERRNLLRSRSQVDSSSSLIFPPEEDDVGANSDGDLRWDDERNDSSEIQLELDGSGITTSLWKIQGSLDLKKFSSDPYSNMSADPPSSSMEESFNSNRESGRDLDQTSVIGSNGITKMSNNTLNQRTKIYKAYAANRSDIGRHSLDSKPNLTRSMNDLPQLQGDLGKFSASGATHWSIYKANRDDSEEFFGTFRSRMSSLPVKTEEAEESKSTVKEHRGQRNSERRSERKSRVTRMATSLERSFSRVSSKGRMLASTRGSSLTRNSSKIASTKATVLVKDYLKHGKPPDVTEVLVDLAPPPFNLARFREWAADNLLDENLDFFYDVGAFRGSPDSEVAAEARHIVDMFVRPGADMEVNLSSTIRDETMIRVETLLEAQSVRIVALYSGGPGAPPLASPSLGSREETHSIAAMLLGEGLDPNVAANDTEYQEICEALRESFAPAETQVLDLLKMDAYPRYLAALNEELESLIESRSNDIPSLELIRATASFHAHPHTPAHPNAQTDALVRLLKKKRANQKKTIRQRGRSVRHDSERSGDVNAWIEAISPF